MANICCPIETEPRTLNQGQLQQAREIASEIVKNKEFDEATAIFNEELKPVSGVTPPDKAAEDGRESVIETRCQCCSCAGALVDESPDQCRIREPVSAPF